ncbi:MAG: FtsX-like permease family protein [Clostridia bacterium]|nr:FtsX-like permease family protein [Clostridia bacterium]
MKSLRKNILREIYNTKSRFISILAIIGLSVGFFSGLKAACPSMIETADRYFVDQNLMDIKLISTVGFDDDDIRDIKNLNSVVDVMPSYSADLIVTNGNTDKVARVYSLPEKTDTNSKVLNEPVLIDGRMPKKDGECVIESYFMNMEGYKIGDTITFKDNVDGKSTDTFVKSLSYKIVGTVESPLYLTFSRGNTNVGSGTISFYMMIKPEEFNYERYTNVYVTTKASQQGLSGFSDEYKEIIDDETTQFEELSSSCINRFNSTTLSDAKKKLSDAQKEYAEKKQEAENEISDGEKKLYNAQKEFNDKIVEAEQKISDSEKQLSDAKTKLSDGQAEYQTKINDAYNQLVDAQKQYDDGQKKYNDAKLQYDTKISQAQSKLNAAQSEYDRQYNQFYNTTKPQAETQLTILKAAIDLCNSEIDKTESKINDIQNAVGVDNNSLLGDLKIKLNEYRQKLDEYQKQYDDGMQKLADGEKLMSDAMSKLTAAQEEFEKQKADGAEQLNDAKSQLDSAQSQLEIGKLTYENAMNNGMLELQSAQAQISEGEKQLEQGKNELETQKTKGQQELKAAREKLTDGKYEANLQLSSAEEKLNDAQKTIDNLEDAKWYVYSRDNNAGYSGLIQDAQRVDSIATVFPLFFLVVAVLVCLTTMTRMVEERRTEIGTLKALGYSNMAISAKYFIYAAVASLSGSIIGTVLGLSTLPFIIVDTYGIMYTLPPTKLVIPWDSVIYSTLTGLLCTCVVALVSCFKELKIKPATLMRPKAPKPGKRILLEHITPIWKHMNFTSKVTARNLFRYKARFLMTVIGVAGCTALIVASFGLKGSISVIAERQFGEITKYDEVFALSESGTSSEKAYLMSQFHADDRFSSTLLSYQGSTTAYYKDKDKNIGLSIVIGDDQKTFKNMFDLRERKNHKHLELDDSGIIVTERMSEVLGIKVGDTIHFTIDEDYYTSTVKGITENYAGNYMYMTPEYYRQLTGREVEYNMVMTSLADDISDTEEDIANDWMQNEDIITVTLMSETIASVNDMLKSLDIIVFVMIFCAGLLAIIVLYNLTNINIAERVREIATIKVLGFYNRETANYIYRENLVLTVVGALVGMFLGSGLTYFIINTIQMDMVMFSKDISIFCYIMGFVLTLVFSLFVNFIMYFKMKKISMVESLKSIE